MIKLFVSDLDGTLLVRDQQHGSYLPDYNLAAIHRLNENGIKFAIASGRHQNFLEQLLAQIGLPCDIIGENGAMTVIENIQHLVYLNRSHCAKMIKDFYRQPETKNLNMTAMLVDGGVVVNSHYASNVKKPNYNVNKATSYHRYDLETYFDSDDIVDVVKLAHLAPETADIEEFVWLMRDRYADYFDIYSSGFRTIEYMAPGIDKGYGLRMIMAHYNLSDNEIAVIGDADNDISMMLYSGHAYGMASGDPHIRKYCAHSAKTVAQAIDEVIAYNKTLSQN